MTGPLRNSEFCIPRISMFPSGPVIKCLLLHLAWHTRVLNITTEGRIPFSRQSLKTSRENEN